MLKNPYPGKFIVFEGLDGSGKSVQAELMRNFLIGKGYQVLMTKEPTLNSLAGRRIRQILDEKTKEDPREIQRLFTEDRKENLENTVYPALEQGKTVISDRYFFSTFAYGKSDGVDLEWMININDNFILPDFTFIMKVSPEVCLARIEKRGEGIKLFEKRAKLERVWETYLTFPARFTNVYMIDGEGAIEDISQKIIGMVEKMEA